MTTQNTEHANSRESNASSDTGGTGSTPSSADDLNWGSARSDYGKNAYGGSLNKKGMGGKSIDDFKQGRRDVGSRGYRMTRTKSGSPKWSAMLLLLTGGIGVGAALMYILDPEQGNRRRKQVREKIADSSSQASKTISETSRSIRDRTEGLVAEAQNMIASKEKESGMPGGGQGRKDEVGHSGVYRVSDAEKASPGAKVKGEKSFGQGARGASGYEDSGSSEL